MVQHAGELVLIKSREIEFFQFFSYYLASSSIKPGVGATVLNAVLSSCTGFRTYDESVSFHNKVVAESGMGSKRSVLEFPFRCSYKKLPLSGLENYLQPLYHHGQGNGVNKGLERLKGTFSESKCNEVI